jgi:hypothetical protein
MEARAMISDLIPAWLWALACCVGAAALWVRVELLSPRLAPWRSAPLWVRAPQDGLALLLLWEGWELLSIGAPPSDPLLLAAVILAACALAAWVVIEPSAREGGRL